MSHCKICGRMLATALLGGRPLRHTCPPQWRVWWEKGNESPEDYSPFYADDAAEAAEKWAEAWDEGAPDIAAGQSYEVKVQRVDDEEVKTFSVYGEFNPTYYAREVES
jgi:hypothetical protein